MFSVKLLLHKLHSPTAQLPTHLSMHVAFTKTIKLLITITFRSRRVHKDLMYVAISNILPQGCCWHVFFWNKLLFSVDLKFCHFQCTGHWKCLDNAVGIVSVTKYDSENSNLVKQLLNKLLMINSSTKPLQTYYSSVVLWRTKILLIASLIWSFSFYMHF